MYGRGTRVGDPRKSPNSGGRREMTQDVRSKQKHKEDSSD